MATHSDVFLQFALAFPEPLVQPHAWLLAKRLQEGHICISLDTDPQLASGSPAGAYPSTQQLADRPLWIGNAGATTPFILHRNRLYLHRYFQYESGILVHIHRLLNAEPLPVKLTWMPCFNI